MERGVGTSRWGDVEDEQIKGVIPLGDLCLWLLCLLLENHGCE